MDVMLQGLIELFSPDLLLALVLGTLGGALVGAIPGLTATMAVALLVPFTFTMSPAAGLVAIGGLMVGAVFGDAVPACLVNTPGTPSAIATTFDGYPLTKQGKGQLAIAAASVASLVGALIGGFALLLLSPPLAAFSLRFGPPEFFWIGIFGLTVIASLAAGSLWKGLAGGTLGMLLSTVGIATTGAHARYTFGFPELQGGIHVVVALIGLFAVAEALRLVERHKEQPRITEYRRVERAFRYVVGYLFRRPLGLIRASTIGTVVGILPGAGGPIASLVAYNEEVRWSRDRRKYGKGAIEGVAAPECANNAAAPAAMIPLLTLGVPGSPPAAVVLGALLLHGLNPGQDLYARHPDVVYAFIWSMILAGLVIFLTSLAVARHMARVAAVPVSFLAPFIMLLSVVGSFAIRGNIVDVAIMLGFGLLGYVLVKLGFQVGPVALGLILGPIVESGFVTSLALVGPTRSALDVFVLRPITGVLILLTILSVLWPFVSKRFLPAPSADEARDTAEETA